MRYTIVTPHMHMPCCDTARLVLLDTSTMRFMVKIVIQYLLQIRQCQ